MSRPGPFLYVVRGGPDRAAVARLTQLLARHPQHRFDLLCVPYEDDGHGPGHLAGLAHRAFIPLSLDKSPGREWEGDDGAWDLVLSPWALTLHGENRIDRRYRGEPDQA